MRARVSGGVAAQPGNAAAAACTARVDLGRRRRKRRGGLFSPVAGLNTSPQRPLVALGALAFDIMVDVAHALYPQAEWLVAPS